ncbi:prepilin-type N-terminal cleavage/methylation domain-containing protein [Candidatus Gracilibacteria bacterium]|nr:prepilin-type N-terminal cleavage/methylation domain-containing protein [Candidatus Gracilibacteria bacterium]
MAKRGFTLAEVLIATAIFTLAAVIASNILVDTIKLEERISVQNDLYQDVQSIMQSLVREIERGTIDYEEYYSVGVIQSDLADESVMLGVNYGVYGSRFYDPGRRGDGTAGANPDDLGVECSVINDDGGCDLVWTHSTDLNTGKFPYDSSGNEASAFCEEGVGYYCDDGNRAIVTELYLIDESGTRKTIVGKKLVNGGDYVLGLMRMTGRDLDQNGVIDVFSCDEEFACEDDAAEVEGAILYPFVQEDGFVVDNGIRLAEVHDLKVPLNIGTTQFAPISPLRTTIKNLQFIVRPLENPFKAYGEKNQQLHPTVTIVMTVGLGSDLAAEFSDEIEDITVQTTVSAGVNEDIVSYPPIADPVRRFGAGGRSWIWEVLGN